MPKTQAEIIAFQEKKAAQDFIYQTNQSLQNLRISIDDLRLNYSHLVSKSGSDNKDVEICLERLTDSVNACLKNMSKKLDEFYQELTSNKQFIQDRVADMYDGFYDKEHIEECFNKVEKRLSTADYCIERLKGHIDSSMHTLKGQIAEEMNDFKAQVIASIPNVLPISNRFDERVAQVFNEFDGLKKEIAYNKKSVFVNTKNIENLYMLLERMNK